MKKVIVACCVAVAVLASIATVSSGQILRGDDDSSPIEASSAVVELSDDVDEFEIPAPDPRYPIREDLPLIPFPKNPDIDRLSNGGLLTSDERVKAMSSLREQAGLSGDPDLVKELLGSPEAQRQVRDYSIVLTAEEETLWARRRNGQHLKIELIPKFLETEGWVSSPYSDGLNPENPNIVLIYKEGFSPPEDLLSQLSKDGMVVEVRHAPNSYAEVLLAVHDLRMELGLNVDDVFERGVDLPSEKLETLRKDLALDSERMADLLRPLDVTQVDPVFGSPVEGQMGIRVVIAPGSAVPNLEREGIAFLPTLIEPHPEGDVTFGVVPCARNGCGPDHSGIRIEKSGTVNGSDFCTLGPAVISGGDIDWLTAGHCWPNFGTAAKAHNRDESQNWGNYAGWGQKTTFGVPPYAVDVNLGPEIQNSWTTAPPPPLVRQYDGKLIQQPDHLVSNIQL